MLSFLQLSPRHVFAALLAKNSAHLAARHQMMLQLLSVLDLLALRARNAFFGALILAVVLESLFAE